MGKSDASYQEIAEFCNKYEGEEQIYQGTDVQQGYKNLGKDVKKAAEVFLNYYKDINVGNVRELYLEIYSLLDTENSAENELIYKFLQENEFAEKLLLNDWKMPRLHKFWGLAELKGTSAETFREQFNKMVKPKYEIFNKDISLDQQSKAVRNNQLIKMLQSRLIDPATIVSRYFPGGFIKAREAANILKVLLYGRELGIKSIEEAKKWLDNSNNDVNSLENERDPTNIFTTAFFNTRNRVAKQVIGIMANHNINAVYAQILEEFSLVNPIEMFGKSLSDLKNASADGVDSLHLLAELLAASVDAVKDPVLTYLNINSYTASIAALMTRVGFSFTEIGLFLNQPIIKEVCTYAQDRGYKGLDYAITEVAKKYKGTLSHKNGLDLKSTLTSDQKKDILNERILSGTLNAKIEKNLNTASAVLRMFRELARQGQALNDFIADTKFTASNAVDNSYGGVIATVTALEEAANSDNFETSIGKYLKIKVGDAFIEGDEEARTLINPVTVNSDITLKDMQTPEYKESLNKNPFAFEQHMADCITAFLNEGSKYFPYRTDTYKKFYGMVRRIIGNRGTFDGDTVDLINAHLPVYIVSQLPGPFNPDYMLDGISNREYYTSVFPAKLSEFLKKRREILDIYPLSSTIKLKKLREEYPFLKDVSVLSLKNNPLLDMLNFDKIEVPYTEDEQLDMQLDTGKTEIPPRYKYSLYLSKGSQFDSYSDVISEGWGSLIPDITKASLVNNPRNSLVHSLALYNYHTRGFDVGVNVLSNKTPTYVLETLTVMPGVSYLNFFRYLNSNLKEADSEFGGPRINMARALVSFLANTLNEENNLVPYISSKILGEEKIGEKEKTFEGTEDFPTRTISIEGDKHIITLTPGNNTEVLKRFTVSNSTTGKGSIKTRTYVTAFKIKYDGKYRLFVLTPRGTEAEAIETVDISDENYNIRPSMEPITYREVFTANIEDKTIDYSEGAVGAEFKENIYMDTNSEDLDNIEDIKEESKYIEKLGEEIARKENACIFIINRKKGKKES